MAIYETRPLGRGPMDQEVREVYVDGVHYATLRPLGGTREQYGIFLVGSTKRYSNPAMEGPCPDETTIFGLAHACELSKAIHQGHDIHSLGAVRALARRFLSPQAIRAKQKAREAAREAAEAAAAEARAKAEAEQPSLL